MLAGATAIVVSVALGGCTPRRAGGRDPTSARENEGRRGDGREEVETRTVHEGDRTTVITTTKRWVESPPPPPRPADPWPGDPLVRHNVDQINVYRAKHGLPPLLYDALMSRFALAGSKQLAADHISHAHFAAKVKGAAGFGSRMAENQGDWEGIPPMGGDRLESGKKQIDVTLRLMMDEGPGGGHYENIVNPRFRRVGVGLFESGGRLYLTNDFSD